MCAGVSRETVSGETQADQASVSRETGGDPESTAQPRRSWPVRALTAVLLAPVHFYMRFISPGLPPRCRYYPTCSAYAEQALRELGPVRGSIVAGWRLLRCNPLSPGGMDPLEARTLFRSGGTEQPPTHAGTTS